MRVVIAGGSGLLGGALRRALERDGHAVSILTRRPRPGIPQQVGWTPDGSAAAWAAALDGIDVAVNLAGEGIADRRWTAARKQSLRSSRLAATRSLVGAMKKATRPPAVFVSGSAVGYYGPRGDEPIDEATPPGSDFLAGLSAEWEHEAEQASSVTRVALIRTGLVLDAGGGALGQMLTPFRLGVGGPLGAGTQYMSWIHTHDWVNLVVWLIGHSDARGPFNATAPVPVTNAEFTRTLGRVLSRPAFVPVPGFALRLLVGELADALLTGQRVLPARAERMGFEFRFRDLEPALRDLLR